MQWITLIELVRTGSRKFVREVNECKVLQTPATTRVCRVDCWNMGRELAWQMYHVERHARPVNHGCTITLTPVED